MLRIRPLNSSLFGEGGNKVPGSVCELRGGGKGVPQLLIALPEAPGGKEEEFSSRILLCFICSPPPLVNTHYFRDE